jgi:hypothetical protein
MENKIPKTSEAVQAAKESDSNIKVETISKAEIAAMHPDLSQAELDNFEIHRVSQHKTSTIRAIEDTTNLDPHTFVTFDGKSNDENNTILCSCISAYMNSNTFCGYIHHYYDLDVPTTTKVCYGIGDDVACAILESFTSISTGSFLVSDFVKAFETIIEGYLIEHVDINTYK